MKTRFSHLRPQRGAALALVLWAVFVMTTVVVVTLKMVDFDLGLGSAASKRFSSRQLALTGIAYGSHPKVRSGDALLLQDFPDASRLEVRIQSEDARLNINTLLASGDASRLQRLFEFWGVEEKAASVAADSLKDWVDEDDLASLNGAEGASADPGISAPENRPFLSVEEMENVRGMAAVTGVKPDWKNYFSVRSSGRLDLQDVPGDLLEVFGLLTREQARDVENFRNGPDGKPGTSDDGVIDSVKRLAAVVPLSPAQAKAIENGFGADSKLRRITSRGHCGNFKHEIVAVTMAGRAGYLAWKEGR